MLQIDDKLAKFGLGAGEPFLFEVQFLDATGAALDLSRRAFVLSFYGLDRVTIEQIDGERLSDVSGPFVRFVRDGRFSEGLHGKGFGLPRDDRLPEGLYSQAITVELAERYRNGRNILAIGTLAIAGSSSGVASYDGGAIGQFAVRATLKADAGQPGVLKSSTRIVAYQESAAPPVPAFVFTGPASIVEGTPPAPRYAFTGPATIIEGN